MNPLHENLSGDTADQLSGSLPTRQHAVRLTTNVPALVLAPMDGLADAPMRAVQTELGAFTFAVAEFVRISDHVPPKSVFYRDVPELRAGGVTPSGTPVQVQLLGGHPERMAKSALVAHAAGAEAIDINFGCPAPTVNSHDGGATLLKHPRRIRDIVAAVRAALPAHVPVSAKMRLGWDTEDAIFENAAMAAEGGASWLTIHGRTRDQGYKPPVCWHPIGIVRERLSIPVVANGDIWSLESFRRCREETGCLHYMLGRGALANPFLCRQIACELGLPTTRPAGQSALPSPDVLLDWRPYLQRLIAVSPTFPGSEPYLVRRLKQWLNVAHKCGNFTAFDAIKRAETVDALFALLARLHEES